MKIRGWLAGQSSSEDENMKASRGGLEPIVKKTERRGVGSTIERTLRNCRDYNGLQAPCPPTVTICQIIILSYRVVFTDFCTSKLTAPINGQC